MSAARRDRRRAAAALALLAASCTGGADVLELRGRTMGTTYSIKAVGGDPARLRRPVDEVLAEIDAKFSTHRQDSEIARCNAHRGAEPFQASAAFAALLRQALAVAERTDGAFDPTVLPLVELWGLKGGAPRQPQADEIAAALARVGHGKVTVGDGDRVHKAAPEVALDFDGIAPGLAVDRLVDALRAVGVTAVMVEIGGEVRCAGSKPDGSAWQIGIERPPLRDEEPRDLAEVVAVRDFALATSGSYRKFVEAGGRRVHHILDPRTGRNADNDVVSASVRASTCALADALATAFMVLGPDRADGVLDRFADARLGVLFLLRRGGTIVRREVRW